jgi:hypothetical protein
VIIAHIPFECPQCGRGYHMELDLLKLTRLNRVAVCGRCRNEFSVQVHFDDAPDDAKRGPRPRLESQPRLPAQSGAQSPRPRSSSPARGWSPDRRVTPASGSAPPPGKSSEPGTSGPPIDSEPPPSSRPGLFRSPPSDAPITPPPGSQPGTPAPISPPIAPRSQPPYPRWPSSGKASSPSPFAARRGSNPFQRAATLPGGVGPTRNDDASETPRPIPRSFERQIVVDVSNVGSQGPRRRQRKTFRPENLVTKPHGGADTGDDDENR